MSQTTTHWGEFPEEETEPTDVTADINRAMNKFNLIDYELNDELAPKMEVINLPIVHPLVTHAITLHKYANNLQDIMDIKQETYPSQLELKPVPIVPEINLKHRKNNLNYIPKEFTDFSAGLDVELPELNRVITKEILAKCVAILLAQIGFEFSFQSVLDVLTDVLEEFFEKVTRHLRIAERDEQNWGSSGFPHLIERVLTELGMGGAKGIHDYYQCRVIKYVHILQKRYEKLRRNYENNLKPKSSFPTEDVKNIVRVKVEEDNNDVVEMENAEVHFSTIDGDVSSSIFKTGYQLLNRLEAETSLQNFVASEEEMSSELPVISIPSDNELSHLSPCNKKKRFKKDF